MSTTITTLRRQHQLQDEISLLEKRIHALDDQFRQDSCYGNDLADAANELLKRAENLAVRRHTEKKLWQLKHALARLAAGLDSTCEMCGEQIDPARIEAMPEATLCISCQRRKKKEGLVHPSVEGIEIIAVAPSRRRHALTP